MERNLIFLYFFIFMAKLPDSVKSGCLLGLFEVWLLGHITAANWSRCILVNTASGMDTVQFQKLTCPKFCIFFPSNHWKKLNTLFKMEEI